MKNKGYTLIELLGVIIILSILVSFAVPTIINVIKSSTNKKDKLVEDLIINAAEMYVDDYDNEFYAKEQKSYCVSIRTLVELDYLKDKVEIDGKDITDLKSVKIGYRNKFTFQILDSNKCIENYYDGEVVYFDVSLGKSCNNYNEVNSDTGYNGIDNTKEEQNSCLKFYAFNDDGKENLNLILDHNTTSVISWNSSGNNAEGPKQIIEQLKLDTKDWKGTNEITNYKALSSDGKMNYEVDYSEYKARLMTSNEVAKLTQNESFDELKSNGYYYLDTNTTSKSSTCTSGNITGCKFGWLYDRSSFVCEADGCLNNSNEVTAGYWLVTSVYGTTNLAWHVNANSSLSLDNVASLGYGVRPVIEVLKTNL